VLCRYISDSAFSIVNTPLFGALVLGMIVVNAIALATLHSRSTDTDLHAIDTINLICTVVFAFEMVLKILSYGFSGYIADSFNIFDGIVVIFSVADEASSNISIGISVFRLARVLRLFRVTRGWQSMRTIIEVRRIFFRLYF